MGEAKGAKMEILDFLFTIAIAVGIAPGLAGLAAREGEPETGLYHEPWVREGRAPAGDEWVHLGAFLVGLLTLTLSWVGYNWAVEKRPHTKSIAGMGRFVIDVGLIILYGAMLLAYRDLPQVMFYLLLVHLAFVPWSWLKIREYYHQYRGRGHVKRWDSVYVALAFAAVAGLAWALTEAGTIPKWASLVLGLGIVVGYRKAKAPWLPRRG